MKKIYLKDFVRGWLVGNFEPSLIKSEHIEVAVQSYKQGDHEPQHHHKVGTEISIMINGSASFNEHILKEGEGIIINPKEANVFKALSDCNVLVIKYPSEPQDKYFGEYID